MSLPKEPRQLMINLMYLVLTALLAMNVSKEVINAFTIVDDSIKNSNVNIDDKNSSTMVNFDAASKKPKLEAEKRDKINRAMALAQQVRSDSKTIENKLKAYHDAIIERAGGMVDEEGDGIMKIKRQDDLEAATAYMVTEGNGSRMKTDLTQFKSKMAAYIDSLDADMVLSSGDGSFAKRLPINLNVKPGEGSWSEKMFTMVPAVAATTIINKFINDVKNSESAVLDELWASAMGEAQPYTKVPKKNFNKYGIIANLDNSYALPGQTINMQAMLGAFNANSKGLRIWINGRQVTAKEGIAQMKIKANSKPGKHTVRVRAQYLDKGKNDKDGPGTWKSVDDYTLNYFVGQPQASISLDEMKIFYEGLDNPMTVAASGVPLNDITVQGGPNIKLIKTGPGKYKVQPTKNSGTTWVSISGKRSDGTIENFGGKITYRLGRVPNPTSIVAGKTGDFAMPVNAMKVQRAVFAKLKGFPYNVKYKVIQYNLFHVPGRRGDPLPPVKIIGSSLRVPAAQEILKKLKVGDRLYIEGIKAVGPDKRPRKLGPISIFFPN